MKKHEVFKSLTTVRCAVRLTRPRMVEIGPEPCPALKFTIADAIEKAPAERQAGHRFYRSAGIVKRLGPQLTDQNRVEHCKLPKACLVCGRQKPFGVYQATPEVESDLLSTFSSL